MKDNEQSKSEPESDGMSSDTGGNSETSEANSAQQKRKTIKIRLPPKPYAPRSSAVVIRYAKLRRQ